MSRHQGPGPAITKKRPLVVGQPDLKLLASLNRYHFLTAAQMCRLYYSPTSITFVQEKAQGLARSKYVQRVFLPRLGQHGSSPSVYRLATRGMDYLKSAGYEVGGRYRPSEEGAHSYLFLSHTLAVNDVLMAGELLCRQYPTISLENMIHERDLKKAPMYVSDGGTKKLPVIPDGYLDFRLNGEYQVCIALEVDMGTTEQRRFRKKVRELVACASGPYQERFGTPSLTYAVVAVPGEKRFSELLRWTELELRELGAEDSDLFRLTSLSGEKVPSEELYLASRWYRPFDPSPLGLLTS